jgi:hypothetical protein
LDRPKVKVLLGLAYIEDHSERVPEITSRKGSVLLDYDTSRGDKFPLGGLDVFGEKFKNRPVAVITLFDIKAERPGFEPRKPFILMRHRQAENRTVKLEGFLPVFSRE